MNWLILSFMILGSALSFGEIPKYDRYTQVQSTRSYFLAPGKLVSVDNYKLTSQAPFEKAPFNVGQDLYQANRSGYFSLLFQSGNRPYKINLFVPPVPSINNDLETMDWYKTQYNSGTPSNCGPTSVAMAISWATSRNIDIYDIRLQLGWSGRGINNSIEIQRQVDQFMAAPEGNPRNGGTNMDELMGILRKYQIKSAFTAIQSVKDLSDIIDRGNIAIVLINTADLTLTSNLLEPYGRYYDYAGGHYVVIKGRSTDGSYFVVNDPMPSDWNTNGVRYGDNSSMIGRNRYYKTSELIPSIRNLSGRVIEVSR